MKYTKLLFAAAIAGSIVFIQGCNSASSNEAVNLKFNLEKGKTYEYEMDVDMQNEVQGQQMNSQMEFDYMIEVIDEKDGIKTVKSTYDRVKMNMAVPGQNLEIDTDKPVDTAEVSPSNPMGMMNAMFQAIKGKSFTMKVNPEGDVVDVSGLDEMSTAMFDGMKLDPEMKSRMEASFKQQFNEESMKQSFSQAFNIFPNKAVKVGDTWNKDISLNNGMMKMKTAYTVKSINGDKVTLDANSTFDMMGSSGKQTGTFVVSAKTGLVTDGNYTQTFGGPMKMTSKGKITGTEK